MTTDNFIKTLTDEERELVLKNGFYAFAYLWAKKIYKI